MILVLNRSYDEPLGSQILEDCREEGASLANSMREQHKRVGLVPLLQHWGLLEHSLRHFHQMIE